MKDFSIGRWLTLTLILFLSGGILSSCGDDDDNPQSLLCGTWENQAYIYHFGSDGNGYFQYSPSNGTYDVWGDTKSYFTWSASSTVLSITRDGSGMLSAGTSTYYYEVSNKMLVIIDMNSGESNSFTKN